MPNKKITLEEVGQIYKETMRQMDIDFEKELTLIRKTKTLKQDSLDIISDVQTAIRLDRESFLSIYSWTIIPDFFSVENMRKDYLSNLTKYCDKIYDEIYNS